MRKKIFLCLFFSTCLFAFVHGQTDSENNLKFDEEKDTVIHLEEHVVVGRHIRKTSLLKLPVALSEMPLTMSVVEGRVLSDLNITDLLNINKTTTGIRVMNNYGGFHMFRTRGLNGVVLLSNGIRDERSEFYSCAPTSSFVGVNRIEVLKGPSSAMIGHSAIGGIINIIYNQPSATASMDAKLAFGSWNTYTAQLGASGSLSSKVNFRIDYTGIQSDGWRKNDKKSHNIYLALDFRPNIRNKFSFSAIAYDNRVHTDPGIPRFFNDIYDESGKKIYSIGDIPEGVDLKKTNLTYVDDHLNDKHLSTTNIWEHTFSDQWKLRNIFGLSYNTLSYLQSEEFSHLTSKTSGRYKHYYLNGKEKRYISIDSIIREPFHFDYDNYYIGNQIEIQGSLDTWGINHLVSFGHDFSYMYLQRWQGSNFSGPATTTAMSIYHPIANPGYLEAKFTNRVNVKEYYHSLSLFDQVALNKRWSVMLALRYNLFRRKVKNNKTNHRTVTEEGMEYILPDNALTYKFGLIYEFAANNRIYASVSNSFRPIRTIGDKSYIYVDNKGNIIEPGSTGKIYAPERGMQYEIGLHSKINDVFLLELSAFHIRKTNIVQKLGKNTEGKSVIGQVGTVNSDGFETEVTYSPVTYLSLRGGYAFTTSRVGEYSSTSISKSEMKGNYLPYSPVHTAFGWIFFNNNSIKHLFRLGIGFDYSSKSYADLANEMWFNPAFVGNIMVSYRYNKNWTLQLNIDNIFDKRYAKAAENTIQWLPEPGRNITLSAIFHL